MCENSSSEYQRVTDDRQHTYQKMLFFQLFAAIMDFLPLSMKRTYVVHYDK